MLYYFKKGKTQLKYKNTNTNEIQIQKKICAVYGDSAVTDGTCQK